MSIFWAFAATLAKSKQTDISIFMVVALAGTRRREINAQEVPKPAQDFGDAAGDLMPKQAKPAHMSLTRLGLSPQCSMNADNDGRGRQAPGEVTQLLQRWADGDATALEGLWPLVYDDVRRLARRQMAGERGDHTLQGTALVNEAFIRLAGQRVLQWENREQFLSLASQIMRRVLVDHARQRGAQRRGEGAKRMSIHDTQVAIEVDEAQAIHALDDERVDVLAIDAALTRLAVIDAPQSRIVELRYFGGLTLEETASVAGISLTSVKRELAIARAWLRRELEPADADAGAAS